MRTQILGIVVTVGLLLQSCTTVDHANYGEIERDTGIALTLDDTPVDVTLLGLVFSEQTGFYLFGTWPLHSVTMDESLRELAKEAAKLGAQGVAQIRVIRETPAFFSFSSSPFPWTASIQLQGQAFRAP